jgi:hypothetical protein
MRVLKCKRVREFVHIWAGLRYCGLWGVPIQKTGLLAFKALFQYHNIAPE